jgi:hypothetical protein
MAEVAGWMMMQQLRTLFYGRTPLIEDIIIEILKDEELQSRDHSGPGRFVSLGCSISALRA